MLSKLSLLRAGLPNFATYAPRPYTGKPYDQVLTTDRTYISPIYAHFYKTPFLPVEGHKEFLYDQDGKEYIDLFAGISCMNIGHSHPRITKIFQEQAQTSLNVSSFYTHPYQGIYA
jgi:acetylornithine/succinyldiaminopimelate/putrescine aminotransferase